MYKSGIHLLLIEANKGDAQRIQDVLREVKDQAVDVSTVERLDAGLEQINHDHIDVVVVDLDGSGEGLDAVDELQISYPDLPVVALASAHEERRAFEAMQAGAQDYLNKSELDPVRVGRTLRFAIERQRALSALRNVSLVDDKTGLYNRAGFVVLAQHQLRYAQRAGRKAMILVADIDGMKEIYQRFGSQASRAALATVAKTLREVFRESDLVARVGRDEFAIFAADSDERIECLTSRVDAQLSARNAKTDYQLSLSYGVAAFDPNRPLSAEELLTRANEATYKRRSMKAKAG